MRIAVIDNTRFSPLGLVGQALDEAGANVTRFTPFESGTLPDGPEGWDGLVVMGGEQSALDDDLHPYLPRLAALMRAFGDSGRPVLGICLGAQVLARAYGATNHLGTAREFGWHRVELTEAGRQDPVLSAAGPAFDIFQWHSDTFALPEGAVHLARSATAACQAFRIGRAVYGTQFHFEASTAVVADYTAAFPDLVEALEPGWTAALPARALAQGAAADAAGLAFARNWLRLARG